MRVAIAIMLAIALTGAHADPVTDACVADLDSLPAFLLANDAGAADAVAQRGADVLEKALADARVSARDAHSENDCVQALRTYLRAWRHGHLGVRALPPSDAASAARLPITDDAKAPRFRLLSAKTALLTLPSFGDLYAPSIERLLATHRRQIESLPYLIVDVRRNSGGSDMTYAPLLPLLAANETRTVGAEFLATPANIAASEAVCTSPGVATPSCLRFMAPVVEAMKSAPAGTFVLPASEHRMEVERPARVVANPRRIAVLIDRPCGSSCEEFVLAVRQSFKVKTFGRPTFGALDFSNMRAHELPSGRRSLLYATSRSLRVPLYRVDAGGISPDQFLPPPPTEAAFDEEIETVRGVLETAPMPTRYRRRR